MKETFRAPEECGGQMIVLNYRSQAVMAIFGIGHIRYSVEDWRERRTSSGGDQFQFGNSEYEEVHPESHWEDLDDEACSLVVVDAPPLRPLSLFKTCGRVDGRGSRAMVKYLSWVTILILEKGIWLTPELSPLFPFALYDPALSNLYFGAEESVMVLDLPWLQIGLSDGAEKGGFALTADWLGGGADHGGWTGGKKVGECVGCRKQFEVRSMSRAANYKLLWRWMWLAGEASPDT
ncbi:hypothetical protein BDK51DRAFT_30171 [Blyttiomyces helicus]|uniref:Uncharacterized protein n=1 Tax=Blyttiomyces helicus TaxID=388810 RepID=A0A4P9WL51_9FUNG|nr:hypothetical protein BDK51DRAFT_30171 [Blyttiomyces helicus]|eukprot:RKO93751.1 hypothetical protein BDK51DRAFT_30171 [Blyttiomyces helicus]